MQRVVVDSPIGGIGLTAEAERVCEVTFGAPFGGPPPEKLVGVLAEAVRELRAYLAGELVDFSVPVVALRGSEFERAVWDAIAAIPYGETRSYGAIARAVDEPGAAQAVGLACNRNPLPIIVPCHRVIGAKGKLVGFGGGLHRKRWLLQLEARVHIERCFAAD